MSIVAEQSLADREPVVTDIRLEGVVSRLRQRYGADRLGDALFVTWIEPATVIRKDGVEQAIKARAVFAVVSPNPRAKLYTAGAPELISTHGDAWLDDYYQSEKEHRHYAGRPDPLYEIYLAVVPHHLNTMKNLRELI